MQDVRVDAIKEINAATAIKQGIAALTDDADAIRDTLEGETNLDAIIRALVVSIDEDKILIDGCTNRIDELRDRKARFEARVDAKRALIAQAMELAEWKKRELDIGTVSLTKGVPQLRVVNEADIPPEFWIVGEPKLDKKAVLAALRDKQNIPGAQLSNAAPSLTIRKA